MNVERINVESWIVKDTCTWIAGEVIFGKEISKLSNVSFVICVWFFFNIWHFDISLPNITLSALGETYMTIMCFSSNTKILRNPQNQKGYQLKQIISYA